MNLIFFQNCVSPHQVPYIKVLAKRHCVTLVAPCITIDERVAMGWAEQQAVCGDINLLIAPTDQQVNALLETALESSIRTVCLFSNITGFKEVKHWLDLSLNYEVYRGVITEAPITYRWPLWMHKIKFVLRDLKYRKYIQYIFAIGEGCADYYRGWGSHWRVVDFAYCVDNVTIDQTFVDKKIQSLSKNFNMCFVGSLSKRKNVKVVLEALVQLRHKHLDTFRITHLTIVGDGPERKTLEQYVLSHNMEEHIHFVGTMPMQEVRQLLAYQDVLVLPSLYDGWGAVVNEALMVGTQVWCSNQCGAKSLIGEEGPLGKVFNPKDPRGLMQIIWNDHGFFLKSETVSARRAKIIQWAMETISPEAIASIMEDALTPKKK